MTHESGDSVGRGDCVLLRASTARAQPFVARIASLWENPEDGKLATTFLVHPNSFICFLKGATDQSM